jgi:hypothetical protein
MNLQHRISAFVQLGSLFQSLGKNESWPGYICGLNDLEYSDLEELVQRAYTFNAWFAPQEVRKQLLALSHMLDQNSLTTWLSNYQVQDDLVERRVAIIMAGNIPLVGFHDLLCVLITGNRAEVKLSSEDNKLMPAFISAMEKWAPDLTERITFHSTPLKSFDAVIATGSNNTARYFEHYFGSKPNIIRKNRTSVAVLTGKETTEELKLLGNDVFDYFGLGCRNVTKLYVPKGYDLNRFFEAIFPFQDVVNHNKYANNFDYHKAIWLLNQDDLLENGFLLLKQDAALVSPVGSMYYEYYEEIAEVSFQLEQNKDQIQCIVGLGCLPFGKAQFPKVSDYADHVDTVRFLVELQ